MNGTNELTVAKWPFFVADGLVIAAAGFLVWFSPWPPSPGIVLAVVLLLFVGAATCLVPYLLEFYWAWQQEMAALEEKSEVQRLTMEKTMAEMTHLMGQWQQGPVPSGAQPEAAAEMNRQLEQAAQALQQWQARLAEQEVTLRDEMAELLREEEERREQFHARLEEAKTQWERVCEQVTQRLGDGTFDTPSAGSGEPPEAPGPLPTVEAVAVEEDAPVDDHEPEPAPVAAAAAEISAERRPVSAGRKVAKKAQVKVRQESGDSLFSTTTVVATAFIGASNKLFLRGEGPGLSWEAGVPMQFVEIGKWSWTVTETPEPVRIQVFKNDAEPDKGGVLTVEPGQRLEIRPEF